MKVRDHRSREFDVTWTPLSGDVRVDGERSLIEHRLAEVLAAMRRQEVVRRVALPLATLMMVAAVLFVLRRSASWVALGGPMVLLPGAAVLILTSVGLLMPATSARSGMRLWRLFARDCASAGWCPACGYELHTSAVEEDGCRVCPECGGAWRRDA